MTWLKKILDTKLAGIVCLVFAIANRIIFTTLNSLIGTDTKIQLSYAENLLAGKGMGVTKYFTEHLDIPVYDTHLFFPPGFSLAIIPFLELFAGDEFKAVLAFDIGAAILFILVIRALGKKIGLSKVYNNIMALIAGCSQYVFFMSWSSTDVIGVTLVIFSFTKMIDVVKQNGSVSMQSIITTGLLFCLPYFFRFMYLPVTILLPSLIFFLGMSEKNKRLKKTGLELLGSTAFFLLILFAISLSISGNTIHVNDYGRGIFPDQAYHWYPFIPASFINLDFAAQLTNRVTGLHYSRVMFFFGIINLVLFVFFTSLLWIYIKRHARNLTNATHSIFIIVGSAISLTIILMLAYLTLTYKELTWGNIKWTFSIDERYFAFLYVFLPMLFLSIVQYYQQHLKKSVWRLFMIIVSLTIATEVLHGIYYNVKIVSNHPDIAILTNSDAGYKSFPKIMDDIKKQYPGYEIFVSSPDQFYLHSASQMKYKAIFDYENLAKTKLKVASKSILVVPVHINEINIMQDYIKKKNPTSISTSDGTFFYIEEIDPGKN